MISYLDDSTMYICDIELSVLSDLLMEKDQIRISLIFWLSKLNFTRKTGFLLKLKSHLSKTIDHICWAPIVMFVDVPLDATKCGKDYMYMYIAFVDNYVF